MELASDNFWFLKPHDAQLVRYASVAEWSFSVDPNTCLIKLRQFSELLAQLSAAYSASYKYPDEKPVELLRRLQVERIITKDIADYFHFLRKIGNQAAHQGFGDHGRALSALKIARQLAIWFHRAFGEDRGFSPGPFVPPSDPSAATAALKDELEDLRQALNEHRSVAEQASVLAANAAKRAETAEEALAREAQERTAAEQLAEEAENKRLETERRLLELQAASQALPGEEVRSRVDSANEAAQELDIDEAETRRIIDRQLQDCGWAADTERLTFASGARPEKGRNLAIAEWPTIEADGKKGSADYALFVGLRCVGMVEAKRRRTGVSTAIDQAERYSKGMRFERGAEPVGGPWGDYCVPFVFSANGRNYLKQLGTASGIWFRDARIETNHRRALMDWPTPDGLMSWLEMDREEAQAKLRTTPMDFGFQLRPYQEAAIRAVERRLETIDSADARSMLVAMATGTGKTKLAIAMLYRLLHSKRFRRICFVVDRSALGSQANDEFTTTRVVGARTFAEIFGLKGLDDVKPDRETRVHICTIQGLVKRVLYPSDPADTPPIDQYDLMVVDECHRGYLLDRELSDQDIGFRDEADYVSKYRRVLEHFDSVKIGLTATPALHTTQIFGPPVYSYSYREAVIDGFLIDHDPPLRIETQLSRDGIVFKRGEIASIVDTQTGEIDTVQMPDDLGFDVAVFNRRVVTEPFNREVAKALVEEIDLSLPNVGKTLIFAVNRAHADVIVDALKAAYREAGDEVEDAAIQRITGDVDNVRGRIRQFRNDSLPKIVVTVDLLTTGVDVPSITNLVFLRRVNSRILYDQMVGRATRRCDDINKTVFRIFDAVGLYEGLQDVTNMRPVAVNPSISLTQLFSELQRAEESEHRDSIREQIIVKLARKVSRLAPEVEEEYGSAAGETPRETLARFRGRSGDDAAAWAADKPKLGPILDWDPAGGQRRPVFISEHPDELIGVTAGYGDGERPEDYLDSFKRFIEENQNQIDALTVIVTRPHELTRAQLKELRLELDKQGFPERHVHKAWADAKNEDIAATIIGFIRQAALGDALIPYEERVRAAIDRIKQSRQWTTRQLQWLDRIGRQMVHEVIVDHEALDSGQFADAGGFKRLNKVFGGQLDGVLSEIGEELWKKAS